MQFSYTRRTLHQTANAVKLCWIEAYRAATAPAASRHRPQVLLHYLVLHKSLQPLSDSVPPAAVLPCTCCCSP